MHPELERLLGTVPDNDLRDLSLVDIRDRRAIAEIIEESISYLRRVIQVRLDILGTELAHRRSGEAPADASELVRRLPEILAEHAGTGTPRHAAPRDLRAPVSDEALTAVLDEIVPTSRLATVDEIDDDELAELVDRVETFEAEVSATRRHLHSRLDALQTEIVRRYRTGEASIDALLP